MIDHETLLFLKTWFADYVKKFQSFNPYYQQNINLKYNHTKRVCSDIIDVGKSQALNKEELRLAEVIALLHDVGRFEQYDRYATFSDAKSEDHAQLGIKIIRQNHVLKKIDLPTRELILRTISYHNRLRNNNRQVCLYRSRSLS